MKKKLPITIGISAYNEEKNIATVLKSILLQKATCYSLKNIIVITDGCTDKTVGIIKSFKHNKIQLIEGKKRKGLASRMNEILHKFDTDILVFTDADVKFGTELTLANAVEPFIKDKNIGLVGGSTKPYSKNKFTAKAVYSTFKAYEEIRKTLQDGNNIFGCSGHLLALRKELAKKISMPANIYATDAFLYFECRKNGFKFKHARKALVFHRTPDNIADQIKQNSRFVSSPHQLATIFGDIVYKEYYIPRRIFLKVTFKQFVKMPFHSFYIFFINMYCKLKAKETAKRLSGISDIVLSTKEGF